MKRPSFQFYPGDWKLNTKLRRCSIGARGAWIEILCVLHDEDEYGVARYPLAELADAAGVPLDLAMELFSKGVLKGSDAVPSPYVHRPRHGGQLGDPVVLVPVEKGQPVWYSSRMVLDEWRRQRQGAGSRFEPGHAPGQHRPPAPSQPPKAAPKAKPSQPPTHGVGDATGDGATSSSSSSASPYSVAKATAALPDGSERPADGAAEQPAAGAPAGPPPAPRPSSRQPVAGPPPAPPVATPAPKVRHMEPLTEFEQRKQRVWRAGKDLLDLDNVPEKQKGGFLALLAGKAGTGEAGFEVFAQAVESAAKIGARPAGGVRDYLMATVQHLVGLRERAANKQADLEAGNDAVAAEFKKGIGNAG